MQEHLFTLQAVDATTHVFVDFWERQYRDRLETLYDANILVKPLTDKAILELFEWKNGGELSERKKTSVKQNYISKKDHESVKRATQFSETSSIDKSTEFAEGFLTKDFRDGGAIWRIFWLHCCNQAFPIYDQHVHRAMVLVEDGRIEELSQFTDERRIELYLTRYLSFHRRFVGEQRKIDRAVHTFGRFIKAWPDSYPRK